MTDDDLIALAREARAHAYAPYSDHAVGAALLGASGRVYTGCNVENAAYSHTICAERTALVKAVSEGERSFTAIAVVTPKGGTPCGACRQVLAEFGLQIRVLIATPDRLVHETTVGDLLPHAFLPADLP
ncbi:MAG: cytidine deaminase [Anaerolineae bacterium]|nr:cytidine deaminase [Anaerolineae bacterium]